jgi:pimeloyl-ACP methyl ester carboxylesterase
MRLRFVRRLPLAYGWLAKRPIPPAVSDSFARPILADAGVRHDVAKILRGISSRDTLAAAARFAEFAGAVRVVWAREDRFFPVAHAERLAAAFGRARLVLVDDAYTFIPEDQPQRLAQLIAEFVTERPARSSTARGDASGQEIDYAG